MSQSGFIWYDSKNKTHPVLGSVNTKREQVGSFGIFDPHRHFGTSSYLGLPKNCDFTLNSKHSSPQTIHFLISFHFEMLKSYLISMVQQKQTCLKPPFNHRWFLSLATHRDHDSTQPNTQTSPVAPLEASKLHGVCNRHSFPVLQGAWRFWSWSVGCSAGCQSWYYWYIHLWLILYHTIMLEDVLMYCWYLTHCDIAMVLWPLRNGFAVGGIVCSVSQTTFIS